MTPRTDSPWKPPRSGAAGWPSSRSNGHTVVPSAPLIYDDPNLLFVNAGMVPFKPYFLGQQTPPWDRATSVQKCVRTGDIEEVGKTTRHGTFFQMNGNFSFGDYFKDGAIEFAWELVTTLAGRRAATASTPTRSGPPSTTTTTRPFATLARQRSASPRSGSCAAGKLDNYWHMGVPGPGGPCSEIYFDRGPEYGREGGPAVDEDRYLEIWNLVFMQEELVRGPGQGRLRHRRRPCRRRTSTPAWAWSGSPTLLQGVDNLYEIDEVYPVLERAAELTGKRYGASPATRQRAHPDDVRLRVVADHVRSALMLIGDGVTPGNEGRGYVLRRLLRRAVRSMRLLGFDEPCLPELLPVSLERMKQSYPELESRLRPDLPDRVRRGGGLPPHPRRGHARSSTPRWRRPRRPAAATLPGDAGVPAARHLRLPDRPDPGDGGRAGPAGRPRGLPPADAGAARAGQGRREGQEGRARQHRGLAGAAGARRDRLPGYQS